jgi:hypothetical protein
MLLVMASAIQAQALTVTPGGEVLFGNQSSMNEITDVLDAYFASIGADVGLLYKDEVGGSDSGAAAGWYDTQYSNTSTDPEDALITWNGGSFINSSPLYLLVKDGHSSPAWYLFDISGWDGMEDIVVDSFWAGAGKAGRGAISNLQIYGDRASVPDGGSMAMLLGLALLGLAGTRRMLS